VRSKGVGILIIFGGIDKLEWMIVLYTKKDLVSFGNYMAKQINTGKKKASRDGSIQVSHADIENWKHDQDEDCLTGTSQHEG